MSTEFLYNGLVEDNLTNRSFEDFKNDYSTIEAQGELFEFLKGEEAYTDSKGDFLNYYFPITDELEPEVETTERIFPPALKKCLIVSALAKVTECSTVCELYHVELELDDCFAEEVVNAVADVDPPATSSILIE